MTNSKKSIIRKLYDWVLHWAETPYGFWALIVLAFMESSFFPIPPDVLLMALVLAQPKRWWIVALGATAASVLGGIFGYGIGYFAWDSIGKYIVENLMHVNLVDVGGRMDIKLPAYMIKSFGSELGGEYLFQVYDKWGPWIVGVFGLTPLPYKLVTITSGVAKINLPVFILTSILARGFRFSLVAFILRLVGEPAKEFIDKYFNILTVVFVVVLVGGFAALKLVF